MTATTAMQDALVIAGMPPAMRLAQAAALNSAAEALALAGLRRRLPHASPRELGIALALQRLGCSHDSVLAERLRQETCVSDQPTDFLAVAARAARACTDLGIPYLIGGGVAATVHGEFRTTRDVDLIVRLKHADARRFAAALSGDFSLDPPDVLAALDHVAAAATNRKERATFMALDRASGYRLDVFCISDSTFDRQQLERAVPISLPDGTSLQIASAEDTVLTKLEWYAITPSDKQWDDVQTILRVQGEGLDRAYLDRWASHLGITLLWALAARGGSPPHHSGTWPPDAPEQARMDI